MKLFDNGEINLEAIKKHYDERVGDKAWNELIKDNFKTCTSEIEDELPELEKIWSSHNITKERCDFRIISVTTCVNVKSFLVITAEVCS